MRPAERAWASEERIFMHAMQSDTEIRTGAWPCTCKLHACVWAHAHADTDKRAVWCAASLSRVPVCAHALVHREHRVPVEPLVYFFCRCVEHLCGGGEVSLPSPPSIPLPPSLFVTTSMISCVCKKNDLKEQQGDMVGGAGMANGFGGMNAAGLPSRSGAAGGLTMSGAMTVWMVRRAVNRVCGEGGGGRGGAGVRACVFVYV